MTLNAIEIWNLNRFKSTYKHEKIKNQKQRKRERESYKWKVDEKKQDGFTRLLSWNTKQIFFSANARGNNTTWKPVSNDQYNFLNTVCNSWIFYTDTFFILW